MSMNNEAFQIDGELALGDVIDNICKYLPSTDLLNVAKVCKSWYLASLREERKRYDIQQLLIPLDIIRYFTDDLKLPYNFNHLPSVVHTKPYVSLFAYERKWHTLLDIFNRNLILEVGKQLPNIVMVMVVDLHLSTVDVKFRDASIKGKYIIKSGGGDILGILFPIGKPQIRTNVASIKYAFPLTFGANNYALMAEHLAHNLRLNECEYPKSTVLLLKWHFDHESEDDSIIKEFHKIIQQSGKEVTLVYIHTINVACTLKSESNDTILRKPFVALRISGRTVESWSTYIHYRARCYDINCKLQALKEKVNKSKRYYIGLVSMSICGEDRCSHIKHPCGDSRMMMHRLKGIFPYIQFRGFYVYRTELYSNPPERHSFPDVFDENGAYNPDFLDQMNLFATIIIISYD